MDIFKRRKDFGDNISKEAHTALRERLLVVQEEIKDKKQSIGESFKAKKYGTRTDAEHNEYAESLSMTISILEQERSQLLERLGNVGMGLAKRAFDDGNGLSDR